MEYIEKQTVIDTLDEVCNRVCQYPKKQRAFMCGACSLGSAFDVLQELPAADVSPVVRCKDCRHRDPEDKKCDSGQTERQGCPFPVHDDYFCAYGEV